ncbi:SpoIIIAH-like family protein [Halanaerobacter jeridensis]|uniref:Stage III sporulation protein AH n=1 Tax=Halanaerobacter jeridensis TaxID=706427 RepID=A0A938XQ58_9FIRM|nr:SpoIIIAH-like family protein [Halanaerobacter jeridensis]MBM7555228.1 stage III sporulation protein AH [Halanaerobacter jeridensis]
MINVIANQEIKRKFAWFLVLMLWVGMVTAVVVHRSEVDKDHIAKMSSAEGEVELNTEEQSSNVELSTSKSTILNVAKKKDSPEKKEDFFVEYRIEREQARSEQINLLREMINNPNSDKQLKSKAQSKLLDISNNIEEEMEIESLIRARGYQDGIAFIHNNSVEVIVASDNLKQQDVAQIGDLVKNTTDVNLKDITIIEKPAE